LNLRGRILLALTVALSTGCYHWVPATLDDWRAHPSGDYRITRGIEVWRGNHVQIGEDEIVFCDGKASSDACARTHVRLPAKVERDDLDVGATIALVAFSVAGVALGIALLVAASTPAF
jgi:hypothetical protein